MRKPRVGDMVRFNYPGSAHEVFTITEVKDNGIANMRGVGGVASCFIYHFDDIGYNQVVEIVTVR